MYQHVPLKNIQFVKGFVFIILFLLLIPGVSAATPVSHFYMYKYPINETEYGAESNPTGNPIGGGSGYSNIITSGTYTATNASNLISYLGSATSGQVVFIASGTSIDLTGNDNEIEIPAGVTLASDRGNGANLGALVYRNDLPSSSLTTFAIGGNSTRITGLRIQGAQGNWTYPDGYDYGDDVRSAIQSYDGFNYTIDNNEIYNWSYAGVAVEDGPKGATPVWVHHNDFHNIAGKGYGYGVVLGGGGKLLFEANQLDYMRHAVATSGELTEEYEARYNIIGSSSVDAVFDAHPNPAPPSAESTTGTLYLIHHNTIHVTDQAAVSIGALPVTGAYIYNNRFADTYATVYQWESQGFGRMFVTSNIIDGDFYPDGILNYNEF